MSTASASARRIGRDPGDVLTVAFGTTSGLGLVAYVCNLPGVRVSAPVVLGLLLACLVAGGVLLGRFGRPTPLRGVLTGLLTALLNLMVLGSLLLNPQSEDLRPAAILWVPGFCALVCLLMALGQLAGRRLAARSSRRPSASPSADLDWLPVFAVVTLSTTGILIAAGGLVTGFGAGMSVEDWPQTKSLNMFLFPFARMTGGIYYEHTHRLLGALVGLCTLVFAVYMTARRADRRLVLAAGCTLFAIVVQGILGGLRVTDSDIVKAIIHGVLGQLIFASMAGIAVSTIPVKQAHHTEKTTVLWWLPLALITQLIFGALLRHVDAKLVIHISLAGPVFLTGLLAANWAWSSQDHRFRRAGVALGLMLLLQVVLGVLSIGVRKPSATIGFVTGTDSVGPLADALITSSHQFLGALLLALSVALLVAHRRLLRKEEQPISHTPQEA